MSLQEAVRELLVQELIFFAPGAITVLARRHDQRLELT